MKPAPFDYLRPSTVDEAVAALAEAEHTGREAKVLAGGQSLVPLLALRMARPDLLVDINRIPGLAGITGAEVVTVGALTRHSELARQAEHPLLAEAARWIGHPAIRTRGTAAGSLAHADPSAELPVVALACDALASVVGPDGVREIPAADLFAGPLMSSLEDAELIVSVRFRRPARWGFAEFARRHGDFALVTAVVADSAIALGGVAATPVRSVGGEAALAGGGSVEDVVAAVRAELTPTGDLHASAEYRLALAGELVRRALAQAGVSA
jgi:carbon-monoxide dehydrogenase medium subunit